MSRYQKFALLFVRLSLGWFFFYAGINQVLDPKWSAAGYLNGANNFQAFYHWLASPSILPIINLVNEWGLVLLGVSLILGIFVRLSSVCGALLMALYYFVILKFPYPDAHSYLIDQHAIYFFLLLYLGAIRAGKAWGLDGYFRHRLG